MAAFFKNQKLNTRELELKYSANFWIKNKNDKELHREQKKSQLADKKQLAP